MDHGYDPLILRTSEKVCTVCMYIILRICYYFIMLKPILYIINVIPYFYRRNKFCLWWEYHFLWGDPLQRHHLCIPYSSYCEPSSFRLYSREETIVIFSSSCSFTSLSHDWVIKGDNFCENWLSYSDMQKRLSKLRMSCSDCEVSSECCLCLPLYLPVICLHYAMLCQPSLIQSVYTQLRSIIVLYVTVPVELVGTVTYTRTSTGIYLCS